MKIDVTTQNYNSNYSNQNGSSQTSAANSSSAEGTTRTVTVAQNAQQVQNTQPAVTTSITPDPYTNFARKPKGELTIDEQNWVRVIDKANKAISGPNTSFEFSVHEGTKAIMVKVIDKDTKEVIRELPPEKILDMIAKMCEMAGLVVDERR